MRYLLAGNGINLQFDNENYNAKQLMLRVLKNCDRDDFPTHVIIDQPLQIKHYIGILFLEARKVLRGEYDKFAISPAERQSLIKFKERHLKNLRTLCVTDIGYEDYYLIHDLACHKAEINRKEPYQNREPYRISLCMKMAYLYAIYNDGALCELYRNYPAGFSAYLSGFDQIFTTNYDTNIEKATGRLVLHLHGQFDRLDDVYDPTSLRNALPDAPVRDIPTDPDYFYLYSNALSTYCGKYKEFQMNQESQANRAVNKMAAAYIDSLACRLLVDKMIQDSNYIIENIGYAVLAKAANPDLQFNNDYHLAEFQNMSGTIEVIGLSPANDEHLFSAIDQSEITECIYYYHGEHSKETVKRLLPRLEASGKLKFIPSEIFWEEHG